MKRSRRLAFFGGSFDPPHCGHLAIARAAADALELDQVLFAPVGRQPLKGGQALASYADRLAMVQLASAADARFAASTLDAPRADGGHNYTCETLQALQRTLPAETLLYCLLGADSFYSLAHWHRAAELLLLCDFIVAARPGYTLGDVERHLPAGITLAGGAGTELSVAGPGGSSTLHMLLDLDEDISATNLRHALAEGSHAASRMLPETVAAYIRGHALYRGPAGVSSSA